MMSSSVSGEGHSPPALYKKDDCQTRSHRFHVSHLPYLAAGSATDINEQFDPPSPWLPCSHFFTWGSPSPLTLADWEARRRPPPPPGIQILSISCSFRENLAKFYVGDLLKSWRPPQGNSGPVTGYIYWQERGWPSAERLFLLNLCFGHSPLYGTSI